MTGLIYNLLPDSAPNSNIQILFVSPPCKDETKNQKAALVFVFRFLKKNKKIKHFWCKKCQWKKWEWARLTLGRQGWTCCFKSPSKHCDARNRFTTMPGWSSQVAAGSFGFTTFSRTCEGTLELQHCWALSTSYHSGFCWVYILPSDRLLSGFVAVVVVTGCWFQGIHT